jgi:uncharacterized protein (TIGR02145 family)
MLKVSFALLMLAITSMANTQQHDHGFVKFCNTGDTDLLFALLSREGMNILSDSWYATGRYRVDSHSCEFLAEDVSVAIQMYVGVRRVAKSGENPDIFFDFTDHWGRAEPVDEAFCTKREAFNRTATLRGHTQCPAGYSLQPFRIAIVLPTLIEYTLSVGEKIGDGSNASRQSAAQPPEVQPAQQPKTEEDCWYVADDEDPECAALRARSREGNGEAREAPREVRIGTQVWSTRNLDVSYFRNGDRIPQAKTAEDWAMAFDTMRPAWCYYENNPEFGARSGMPVEESRAYGKLYNWFAVNDPRGLAPEGWHIPSFEEWEILTRYLGGVVLADKQLMAVMGGQQESTGGTTPSARAASRRAPSRRGQPGTAAPSQGSALEYGGTNSSGFRGLPAGTRDTHGRFTGYGAYGYWWSSTAHKQWPLPDNAMAWYRHLQFFPETNAGVQFPTSPILTTGNGLSIRLVKN